MPLDEIPHNFVTARLEDVVRWGRRNSVLPATFGLACCAIELIGTGAAHYDLARFGMEVFRASPRQADLLIVARDMNIDYPIAIDSDFAIWRAFGDQYWPALYFVDAQGRIRHHHFGEGEFGPSERMIQQLLAEAGHTGVDHEPVPVAGAGAEAAADWDSLRSPESYLG